MDSPSVIIQKLIYFFWICWVESIKVFVVWRNCSFQTKQTRANQTENYFFSQKWQQWHISVSGNSHAVETKHFKILSACFCRRFSFISAWFRAAWFLLHVHCAWPGYSQMQNIAEKNIEQKSISEGFFSCPIFHKKQFCYFTFVFTCLDADFKNFSRSRHSSLQRFRLLMLTFGCIRSKGPCEGTWGGEVQLTARGNSDTSATWSW